MKGSIGECQLCSALFFEQCPACLVRLFWMVVEMGYRWSHGCCFIRCCFQDLFSIVPSILVHFTSSFFSIRLVSVHLVHPYSWIDTTAAWEKLHFILLDRSLFYMIDNLSIESMPSWGTYWCHFQLMRCCYQGTWTCTLISVNNHLEWRWLLFY